MPPPPRPPPAEGETLPAALSPLPGSRDGWTRTHARTHTQTHTAVTQSVGLEQNHLQRGGGGGKRTEPSPAGQPPVTFPFSPVLSSLPGQPPWKGSSPRSWGREKKGGGGEEGDGQGHSSGPPRPKPPPAPGPQPPQAVPGPKGKAVSAAGAPGLPSATLLPPPQLGKQTVPSPLSKPRGVRVAGRGRRGTALTSSSVCSGITV